MKKIYSFLAAALLVLGFAACEDVENPFPQPGQGGDESGDSTQVIAPTGDGTLENPFSAAAALAYTKALAADVNSDKEVYIKGIVVSIEEAYNTEHGNGSFTISDDGTKFNTFKIYRAYYLNNVKYQEGQPQVEVGDTVVVYGFVVNYRGNTPETVQNKAYLYSCSGKGSSTENPGGGEDVPTGSNLLTNGDFEKWTDGKADLWNGVTGNGTMAQSTDAHAGTYSVALNGASTNKRMAYRPLRLKAGTYALSAYGKAATEEGGAFKLGYAILTAGSVANTKNDYIYSSSPVNVTNTTWATDTFVFTLDTDTVVNLVVMNYKNPGKQILIDDVTLTTSNGAILSTDPYGNGSGSEPSTPEEPTNPVGTFVKTTSISNGSYLIAALSDGVYKLATGIASSKTHDYLQVKDAKYADQITTATADEVFTIKAVEGGYTIQDSQNRYLYMKDNFNSFNVDATIPAEGAVWTITANADGTVNIVNVLKKKTIQYSVQYTSYGAYSDIKNILPSLFVKK